MALYVFFEQGSTSPPAAGPFEDVSIAMSGTTPYLMGDGEVLAWFEDSMGGWARRYKKNSDEPEDVFSRLRFSPLPLNRP